MKQQDESCAEGSAKGPSYEDLCSVESLFQAWRAARRGKRSRGAVAAFEINAAENLLSLREELLAGSYRPGGYTSFTLHDSKRRRISAAPFRDRIVHHALVRTIEPVFERRFVDDSYANRRGRGTHAALERCQALARRFPYVLQGDIRQFFPSIDHQILLRLLARRLRDPAILGLCRAILEGGVGVLDEEYSMRYFPGDNLFAVYRPRGLPIGNLTSQFWANVYLDPLDHFVQRQLGCRGYVRYVDDFLLFAHSKRELKGWRDAVIDASSALRLTLHARRFQARPVTEGIPFLGFVTWPSHRRLKSRRGVRYRRHLKALLRQHRSGEISFEQLFASIHGWAAHARHGHTYGLRKALLGQVVVDFPTSSQHQP